MITQTELFPKTKTEIAEVFLEHFQADVESAEKSLGNARAKLLERVSQHGDVRAMVVVQVA